MRAYLSPWGNPWRVFDELMGDFPYDLFNSAWRARVGANPRVNVWESEKGLVVEAEVPGMEPDTLDVAVDANVLTLKGKRELPDGTENEFQRSFNLPFELDEKGIKATVKNGVLTVTIPRKAAAEKRKIAIEKL
ncbi:MAG TPA: Hsp20/alpha crystallin family protein [Kiritimatiellia bacterium]|nr:Hsp20/alpha crystallin family protein [Kiritimatiellia bacterium]HOR97403.1 Hsp20/alpha crystallin family protein [Kiritimatiellia bacterium]HPK37999.1 Hsp20/alpha crystallin family protein [Kiritimatiellia bacterium]HPW75942.1 Hsp20/alpha crystallin family protein [Kiritimatiellia bacterium]HRU19748.1 Hsp20/alpha crystallin family protein [Kiritimatiellia bacterium]